MFSPLSLLAAGDTPDWTPPIIIHSYTESAHYEVDSPTFPYPSGIEAGDQLILMIVSRRSHAFSVSKTPSTVGGFTYIGGADGYGLHKRTCTGGESGSALLFNSWNDASIGAYMVLVKNSTTVLWSSAGGTLTASIDPPTPYAFLVFGHGPTVNTMDSRLRFMDSVYIPGYNGTTYLWWGFEEGLAAGPTGNYNPGAICLRNYAATLEE